MNAADIFHSIPPVYDSHSRILMLGTFPSPKSRAEGFFYGHPQNRFWRVLAEILGVSLPTSNQQKQQFLLEHRIALWDVLASCKIEGASDASIRDPVPNDLTEILQTAQIRAIFCTGQKSAELYKRYLQKKTGLAAITLPSTSPANCAKSLEMLCESYRVILPYLEEGT